MKRNFALAALTLLISHSAHAEWWVGLTTSGETTPGNAVSMFEDQASGNTSPVRTLGGNLSGLRSITDFVLDVNHNEMVIADFRANQIARFDLDASGNMAPTATFSHPAMTQPRRIVAIPSANEYAVLSSSFLLYVPMNAVTGTSVSRFGNFSQSSLDNPQGLVYLTATDEVAVGDFDTSSGSSQGEIRFFARVDDGALATTRRIIGPNTRLGIGVAGLRHDPINHELIALVRDTAVNGVSPCRIVVFADTANGDATPLREIGGGATQLRNAFSLAFDAEHDELAVGVGLSSVPLAMLVFNRTDQGDAAPKRQVSGALTGLASPNTIGALIAVPPSNRLFRDSFE